ncbi:MAG: acyl-CoA dehydrogenase family protein [Myxococcales bacterium]|nr:acyl-CoA dehydrogenase family protein [Myxococcales bacterium]MBL8720979.1 acyl-CoA dehydrogenase family protein [Myxococcales bacterium]
MDLSFSPEERAFREEVRAWIKTAMPPHLAAKAAVDGHFEMPEVMEWHKVLAQKGWVAPHWPVEWGGPGLDVARRFILTEELELAGAPQLSPFGLTMAGPLLMQFGNEAQKQRYLPKILSGEEVWCQGYSEPNAGSDLASLRLAARADGDFFVLDGQKTWTTYAQYAGWIFVLARTDPAAKKQSGISFFVVDMTSPGIRVRPTLTIGGTHAFCDTFFENVRVPKENLVGPLNGGWTLAKALLGHERTLVAAVGHSTRTLLRCKRIARETIGDDGRPLSQDPVWRAKIARMECRLEALRMQNYRAIAGAKQGHAPGPESSILKLRGSEVLQGMFELALDLMGHDGLSWMNEPGVVPAHEDWVAPTYDYVRAATIYAGSNEIQKNIIAKLILGLS